MEHIVNFSFAMIGPSQTIAQDSRRDLLVGIDASTAASFAVQSVSILNDASAFDGGEIDTRVITPIALNSISTLAGSSAARAAGAARMDVSSH